MSERDVEPIGLANTVASPSDLAATATDPGSHGRRRADSSPSEPDPLIGRRLAHFLVQRKLGEGGMGQVYLATDLALDRSVALKVLTGEIASRAGLRERFYREARAQARIQHPNVGHIYYIGDEDGQLFYAMEYIDGETLQQLLERDGRVEPERALELVRMAALGLREGQRLGFAHRDVKPSNLMIDRHGVLKVLDFGLVKEIDPAGTNVALSQESAVLGTPLYLAPEQARGEAIDFRSDMYSLGVTLHQLASGKPPFEAETPIAIISRHLSDVRPRLELEGRHKRLRAGMDALCDRMMAKRREDRFQSYDDLLATVERLSAAHSPPAGFWVRACAATFDFFLLTMMALPSEALSLDGNYVVVLLALPYAILPTARWGKTLGKKLLQIEVTPADSGGPVGLRRAALRTLAQLGPTYLLFGGIALLEAVASGSVGKAIGIAMLVLAFAIPILVAITASFAPGKRALWDRAAGTLVRYMHR
ncbi:MAG TPA: protein kinase [Kofleriaceae bacterium]|nr:protein kinase [Kofleriaceae bacterium]